MTMNEKAEEQFDDTVSEITDHLFNLGARIRANAGWDLVGACNKASKAISEEVDLLNDCLSDLRLEEDNGFRSEDLEKDIEESLRQLDSMDEQIRAFSKKIVFWPDGVVY